MSEPLYIALVAEGPTDRIVIESVIKAVLNDRTFVLKLLQPEDSLSFGALGGGWSGVYHWCKQSAKRGSGLISKDFFFDYYDILILHLDADVASKKYVNGNITQEASDLSLPCEADCPPPCATTDALRQVLLSWCGETVTPGKVVICTPSKSIEAWVVKALFPGDMAVRQGIECYRDPESRLGQQNKNVRIKKCQSDYQRKAEDIMNAWPRIRTLSEAARFAGELLAKVQTTGSTE